MDIYKDEHGKYAMGFNTMNMITLSGVCKEGGVQQSMADAIVRVVNMFKWVTDVVVCMLLQAGPVEVSPCWRA